MQDLASFVIVASVQGRAERHPWLKRVLLSKPARIAKPVSFRSSRITTNLRATALKYPVTFSGNGIGKCCCNDSRSRQAASSVRASASIETRNDSAACLPGGGLFGAITPMDFTHKLQVKFIDALAGRRGSPKAYPCFIFHTFFQPLGVSVSSENVCGL